MKKLSSWLYKVTTWKTVILATVIFVLFISIAAPFAQRYMDRLTDGADSPDTTFGYEGRDLIEMAKDYGSEGRRGYILMRFTFDLAFPFVYLFFLATVSTKLLSYLPKKSRFRCFNIMPFFAVFFDFAENSLAAYVMGVYPRQAVFFAEIASYASMIKWAFIFLSFALVIVLGATRLFNVIKGAIQKKSAM